MTTTCLSCENWAPKKSGDMARHGFAVCTKGQRWTFLPPQHPACGQHKPVDGEALALREKWLAAKTQKQSKGAA